MKPVQLLIHLSWRNASCKTWWEIGYTTRLFIFDNICSLASVSDSLKWKIRRSIYQAIALSHIMPNVSASVDLTHAVCGHCLVIKRLHTVFSGLCCKCIAFGISFIFYFLCIFNIFLLIVLQNKKVCVKWNIWTFLSRHHWHLKQTWG